MKIDVDELLKILPQLIRENDTVKGAILTALSGVVATREDIKDVIREMDKRFEAVDKHFEMNHTEIADLTRVIGLLKGFLEKNLADLQARQGKDEQFMEEIRDYLRDRR